LVTEAGSDDASRARAEVLSNMASGMATAEMRIE
jgi:hypothetical protein